MLILLFSILKLALKPLRQKESIFHRETATPLNIISEDLSFSRSIKSDLPTLLPMARRSVSLEKAVGFGGAPEKYR